MEQPPDPGGGEDGGGEFGGGELGGGEFGGLLGGWVAPALSALRTAVYAAFLFPLPSKSSGDSPLRQESGSRTPQTVMPVQRATA